LDGVLDSIKSLNITTRFERLAILIVVGPSRIVGLPAVALYFSLIPYEDQFLRYGRDVKSLIAQIATLTVTTAFTMLVSVIAYCLRNRYQNAAFALTLALLALILFMLSRFVPEDSWPSVHKHQARKGRKLNSVEVTVLSILIAAIFLLETFFAAPTFSSGSVQVRYIK
jgi:archaellum biogenesis protein FlaJ (TadC family)